MELRPVYITPLTSTDGAVLTVSRLCFDFRDASFSQFLVGSTDGLLACAKLSATEVWCPALAQPTWWSWLDWQPCTLSIARQARRHWIECAADVKADDPSHTPWQLGL